MNDEIEIGKRLRLYREACGLSLRQAAREMGVTAGVLSRAETGDTPIPPRVARRLPPALQDRWLDGRIAELYRAIGREPRRAG